MGQESRFRQDLLFRLNTVELALPPLRERREDIRPIAEFYIEHYGRKYDKPAKALSTEAQTAIADYAWPGNIRALRHAVERAIILSQSKQLEAVDFQLQAQTVLPKQSDSPQTASSEVEAEDLNLDRLEKRAIETALKKHRYNISHTAKELGLTPGGALQKDGKTWALRNFPCWWCCAPA